MLDAVRGDDRPQAGVDGVDRIARLRHGDPELDEQVPQRGDQGLVGGHRRRHRGPAQPKVMPSMDALGTGSGMRIMRNELINPMRPARIGTSRANCSARGLRVGVDADDLVLDHLGFARQLLLELGVAHQFGVVLQHLGDLLLVRRREHGAVLGHAGEQERQARQHDGTGERQSERQPERAGRRVDAGGLADPLLRDRRQRVVVELRHQQAEPRSGDDQRDDEVPARVGTGNDRDQRQHADRQQREPQPDDAARSPVAGPLGRQHRHPEHAEREWRERQAGLHGVVLEHHLQEDRQGDHRPAEGDLLHHLLGDADPEGLGAEQIRIEQRQLPLSPASDEPVGQRCQRDRADHQQGSNGLATLLPHEDAEHDAAHAEHGEDGANGVDATRPRVRPRRAPA